MALPSFNSHRSTFIINPSGKAHTKVAHTQQVRHFVLKEHPKSDKSSAFVSIEENKILDGNVTYMDKMYYLRSVKRVYKYIFLLALLMEMTGASRAQSNKVYDSMIHTLQTIVNDDWLHDDVITLGTDDWVTISFDHFTHDYHRFIYKIVHCNADWTPSELFEVDYMEGFNNQPIEDYENSLNTTMLYTHYRLDLPNDDIQFKVSGNYRVEIYLDDDENEEEADNSEFRNQGSELNLVAVACFRIVEPRMGINVSVTSNTDIDTNLSHQQVSFTLNYPPNEVVDPATEIKPYVYQNSRTDNGVALVKPTNVSPGHSEYTHNRTLIFPAGNEYRRFEVINMHYATQGVDKVEYFAPYYHATLLPDAPRRSYSYDEDHDGRYLIRYNMAQDTDIEADYLFVHFTLDMPRRVGGNLYLTGEFAYNNFTPEYQMTYNEDSQAYEATVLLKQGAYDFMYLWVPEGSSIGQPGITEGNFYEAENEYQVYIYHRPFGGRYDRLVAAQQVKFTQE